MTSGPGKVKFSRGFGLFVLALVVAHLVPLLWTHSEQDACTFGPVSNERYRELLAKAKRQGPIDWRSVRWEDYKAGVLLNEQFDRLSSDLTTVYEKIAAMHALLRATGAEYRGVSWSPVDAYRDAVRRGGIAGFRYHLDVNRVWIFSPIWRTAAVSGVIYSWGSEKGSSSDSIRYKRGVVSFAVAFPSPLHYPFTERPPLGEACPSVPTPEQAPLLSPG
jgi:hypothetical protein